MKLIYYIIFLYNFFIFTAEYTFHDLNTYIYLHIIESADSLENLEQILNLSLTNKKFRKLIANNSRYIIRAIINSKKLKITQSRFFINSCSRNLTNIIKLFFASELADNILDINFIRRFCVRINSYEFSRKYTYLGNSNTTLLLFKYIVKNLVFHKHILNANQEEYISLFRLAIKLCCSPIIKLYIDSGIDVNQEYWDDQLPIVEAIYTNEPKIIKQLLDAGAIIDVEIYPSIAMKPNNLKAVKLLINYGLDIEYLLSWEELMLIAHRSGRLLEKRGAINHRYNTINYLKNLRLDLAQNNIHKNIKTQSCCFIM